MGMQAAKAAGLPKWARAAGGGILGLLQVLGEGEEPTWREQMQAAPRAPVRNIIPEIEARELAKRRMYGGY